MIDRAVFLDSMNYFIHPDHELVEINRIKTSDIRELFSFSLMHSVYPIVYDVVRKSDAFKAVSAEDAFGYKQKIKQLVVGQASRTNLFLSLYADMVKSGVKPLVMKGIILRNLYKYPDYRSSGDEDLLILKEDFYKLDRILSKAGFERDPYEEPLLEHEITFFHSEYGMHLEVHLSLFPESSEAYGRLNKEFVHVFDDQITEVIQGVEIQTLSLTDHMFYLLCHGLKHFLHSGFGIRQVCDMMLFAEVYGRKIDWKWIIQRAKAQHMYTFCMNLFAIGECYLGFSWEKAHLERPVDLKLDPEPLLNDILDSGIYGKSSEYRLHSANITLQAVEKGSDRMRITKSLFPDKAYMSRQYDYVKKHGWLLPVSWLHRGLAFICKTESEEREKVLDMGKKRVELMQYYGIIDKDWNK